MIWTNLVERPQATFAALLKRFPMLTRNEMDTYAGDAVAFLKAMADKHELTRNEAAELIEEAFAEVEAPGRRPSRAA